MKFLKFSFIRVGICAFALAVVVNAAFYWPGLWYGAFGWGNTWHHEPGDFAVHYVDVAHGACTIFQFPDGKTAIIDIGEDTYFPRVDKYIKERIKPHKNRFDYVIETHPDADHNGGFARFKKHYGVGEWFDMWNVEEGQVINGPTYRIQFHAVATQSQRDNFASLSAQGRNDLSPIITVEYFAKQKHVFVIPGDAGRTTQADFEASPAVNEILGDAREENTVVYVQVPHHGLGKLLGDDWNPVNYNWYDFLGASYAIIPVGTRWSPGDIYTVLDFFGVEYYLTRDMGNIVTVVNKGAVTWYFGFDNVPNLVALWWLVGLLVTILCFIKYTKIVV